MSLVDRLGTGVYEFIAEPATGLLKGPDEFVGGVGKGVQSLVTNVISGGFDSVSKITGQLYEVMKNVAGDETEGRRQPAGVGEGLLQGVRGGASEIFDGVTGIFTKPIQKSREQGAKGFFKGLGSGLVGAITAPVTATLRAGSSITQGVAATANQIGNLGSNSVYGRVRPPRYITSRNVVTVYDWDLALVREILVHKYKGKYA